MTRKLPELLAYQLSLEAPRPPAGAFDPAAATRGQQVFMGTTARCGSCHIPPLYTDDMTGPNPPLLHAATEIGANPNYAARSATAATNPNRTPMYRTTPLSALWQHPPYFHDGSAATLDAVIRRYESVFRFALTPEQRADLIAFLNSL